MRKAVVKRMKITKSGKLLFRRAGSNHFNAKESRKAQHRKQGATSFNAVMERKVKQYMMQ